ILAEEKKREWVKSVDCPNVTVDIVVNDDIEKGLLAYAQANEIDILGVLHRNLPLTKRIFNTNHSKLLLNNSAIGLLIYKILQSNKKASFEIKYKYYSDEYKSKLTII